MINMIRNLIKWARISLSGDDSGPFPVSQMTYFTKTADVLMIYPYGIGANPPEDSIGLIFSASAQEANRAAITMVNPNIRPKNLKKGEAYFGNPLTKIMIVAQADGTFAVFFNGQIKYVISENEIKSTSDLNLNVTGEMNLQSSGTANIKSNEINLGEGGQPIARLGDSVQVIITSGDSAGTWNGTITGGSSNNTSR